MRIVGEQVTEGGLLIGTSGLLKALDVIFGNIYLYPGDARAVDRLSGEACRPYQDHSIAKIPVPMTSAMRRVEPVSSAIEQSTKDCVRGRPHSITSIDEASEWCGNFCQRRNEKLYRPHKTVTTASSLCALLAAKPTM